MYSAGMFGATPGMREALTGGEPPVEWLEEAKDRRQRRMHSSDTETLQSQVDHLRLCVAALFRLLVARGVFTVEEAQRLVSEWEAAGGDAGGAAGRDVVSGAELPPEQDPFRGLGAADGSGRRTWRAWLRARVLAAGVLGMTATGVGVAWVIGLARPWGP